MLESNESFGGIPTSIILGGNYRNSHKSDFYELAEMLGLKYKSGAYYIEHAPKDIAHDEYDYQ